MNNEANKKTIQDHILEAAKSGRVRMRPKWHFVLKAALGLVGGVMLVLVLVYLSSFIIFVLRRTGVLFAPGFGSRGWYDFFASLPWVLILLAVVFIVILELLVRHYSFAYRRPLLYSVLGIVLVVFAGGIMLEHTPLHGRLFRYARENRLPPPMGHFYRGFGMQRFNDVHRGTVVSSTDRGFIMEDVRGETSTVVISPRTRLPLGADFAVGDTVVVFGEQDGTAIRAFGIREVDAEPEFNGPPPPPLPMPRGAIPF